MHYLVCSQFKLGQKTVICLLQFSNLVFLRLITQNFIVSGHNLHELIDLVICSFDLVATRRKWLHCELLDFVKVLHCGHRCKFLINFVKLFLGRLVRDETLQGELFNFHWDHLFFLAFVFLHLHLYEVREFWLLTLPFIFQLKVFLGGLLDQVLEGLRNTLDFLIDVLPVEH